MLNNSIRGQFSDSVIAESTEPNFSSLFLLTLCIHSNKSAKPTISHLHQQSAFRKQKKNVKERKGHFFFWVQTDREASRPGHIKGILQDTCLCRAVFVSTAKGLTSCRVDQLVRVGETFISVWECSHITPRWFSPGVSW